MDIRDKFINEVKIKGEEFVRKLNEKNNSVDFSYRVLHTRLESDFWFILLYKNTPIYGRRFEMYRVVKDKRNQEIHLLNDVEYLDSFIYKVQSDLEEIDKNFVINKIGIY